VPKLTETASVLLVKDVVVSSEYFRAKLGFEDISLFGKPPNFAIVRRDGIGVMLAQKPKGVEHRANWEIVEKTWNVYFWVDDADAIYKELQQRGAKIDYTIYNTPWGTREFGVQDLDNHDIAFGQRL
jgi:uncharacterized glyoxalase superfamily protein PhnB